MLKSNAPPLVCAATLSPPRNVANVQDFLNMFTHAESFSQELCWTIPDGISPPTFNLAAGGSLGNPFERDSKCEVCSTGRSRPASDAGCVDCSAGKFQNSTEQTSCTDCPRGTSSGVGSSDCAPCPPGLVATQPGTPTCLGCGAGEYATKAGSEHGDLVLASGDTCALCPAGSVTATSGSLVCTPCPPSYSSFEGQSSCGHEQRPSSKHFLTHDLEF